MLYTIINTRLFNFFYTISMNSVSLKILLVDDSNIVLQRMQPMLYDTLTIEKMLIVFDADDAMLTVQNFQPHVVLLDINLPTKNGIEVLKYIKANHSHVKVIMVTSQPADQYQDLCMRLGADAFIDKSIDFEIIPIIIKKLTA